MRPVSSFDTLTALEDAFTDWANENLNGPDWKRHASAVANPIPKEPMNWRPHLIEVVDAFTWANDLRPDAESYEIQALAIASADNKVAVAQGMIHRQIRAHKALKRLAESADRKSSVMQSLIKV